ncbi:hypothetical protein P7K49_002902, partial [Saguinus oedipus]
EGQSSQLTSARGQRLPAAAMVLGGSFPQHLSGPPAAQRTEKRIRAVEEPTLDQAPHLLKLH